MKKETMKKIGRALIACAIPVVLILIPYVLAPGRITMQTLKALLSQATISAILGWGMMFSMEARTMDLAVGAKYLFAAIFGGNVAQMLGLGNWGALPFCLLIGFLVGLFDGCAYRYMRLPSIVVAIAMSLIYESAATLINNGAGVKMDLKNLFMMRLPWNVIFPLVAFIVAYFLFYKTPIGYHAKAVGLNAKVAVNKGINLGRTKMICYLITGTYAGLYAFAQLMRVGVVKTVANLASVPLGFDAMMCCFLAMAMASLINEMVGIFIGALTIQILQYALLIVGVKSEFQSIAVGICVLIFLGVSNNSERMNAFFERRKMRRQERMNY